MLIELLGQAIFQLGCRSMVEALLPDKQRNKIFAGIGYAILGVVFGAVSLKIYPHYFVIDKSYRVINLLTIPIALGILMSYLGNKRIAKGDHTIGLDKFSYGFLFAFFMALVRLLGAS